MEEDETRSLGDRVLYTAQVVVLLYSGVTAIQGLYNMGSDAGKAIGELVSKQRKRRRAVKSPLKVVGE